MNVGLKKIILDSDGVVTRYNSVVPAVWRRAFGETLEVQDPNAYLTKNRFNVNLDDPAIKAQFFEHFQADAWAQMDIITGAKQACDLLVAKGYELVCVTAMPDRYRDARIENFRRAEIPITTVYTAPWAADVANSKLALVHQLRDAGAVAFVDDLLHHFIGIEGIERVWLHDREYSDCPSAKYKEVPGLYTRKVQSLWEFAEQMPVA